MCVHAFGCGCGFESEACVVLLHAREPLLPRRFVLFCFVLMSKWAQAKFTYPLHKAAVGCGGTGGACSVPQTCLSKGRSVIFQDNADEMMPALRTRLHFAARDAATECEKPVTAKAPRLGEQRLTGVTTAQQGT